MSAAAPPRPGAPAVRRDRAQVVTPAPDDAWDRLAVGRHIVVSQTRDWRDCMVGAGEFEDVSRLYQLPDGGEILLPLARRRARPRPVSTIGSWPTSWGVGGPLVGGRELRPDDVDVVYEDLIRLGALRTQLRMAPASDPLWAQRFRSFRLVERTNHVVDLEGGFDAVWERRFASSARRAVRKAEQAGIDVQVGRGGELLDAFDQLRALSLERWAGEQHEPAWLTRWRDGRETPPRMVASVVRTFGTRCATWVASHEGTPVASIVVLQSGTQAKYWHGAMDKERANPLRANDLLHRLVIEDACTQGLLAYDMGRTRAGSSLARYKEKLGAVPYDAPELLQQRVPVDDVVDLVRRGVKRVIRFQDA